MAAWTALDRQLFEEFRRLIASERYANATAVGRDLLTRHRDHAAIWFWVGISERSDNHIAEALQAFQTAHRLAPTMPEAAGQAALCLQLQGKLAEARALFEAELRLRPNDAKAHYNLGALQKEAGDEEAALESFAHAATIAPHYTQALTSLAELAMRLGRQRAGVEAWRSLTRLAPQTAEYWLKLGHALLVSGAADEAVSTLARAASMMPNDVRSRRFLVYALKQSDRIEQVRQIAADILTIDASDIEGNIASALAMPVVFRNRADMLHWRNRYERGLDSLERALPAMMPRSRDVLDLSWENFHLAYQGEDDRAFQRRYAEFLSQLLSHAAAEFREPMPPRARQAGERIRVGFASSFFRDCTCGKYFESWVEQLPKARFQVFVYHWGAVRDGTTQRIAASVDQFRWIRDGVLATARAMRDDKLDLLIYPEIGMDLTTYLLANMRVAPLQAQAWGHPVTSGGTCIDAYLSVDIMEPPNAEAHYNEPLVRLPGIGTCYAMPKAPPQSHPVAFQWPRDRVLLLVPQSLFKLHPDNDALLARVMQRAPGADLVMFRDENPGVSESVCNRLFAVLAEYHVNPEKRVHLLPRMPHADFLAVNRRCDVMLDTLRWSGGNTSLDAIASGLPMITLPGRFMRGRQSAGMLKLMGLDELIARDQDHYVEIAVRLAEQPEERSRLKALLAERRGRIFNDQVPIAALADWIESRVISTR